MKHKLISSLFATLLFAVLLLTPTQLAFAAPPSINITSPAASETVGSDFTVTGTATSNVSVQVSVNGDVVDTVTADGSGNWSVDVTGQSDGAKTITATATGTPLVYVGTFAAGNLYVFDSTDNTQVAGSPFAATAGAIPNAISPDGSIIYDLIAGGPDTFAITDTSDNTDTTYTLGGGSSLAGGVFNSDGSLLYIADMNNAIVHVVETATFTEIDTITVDTSNQMLAIANDDSTLYVGSNAAPEIYAVDLSDESYDTITITNNPQLLLLNNAGDRLYASQNASPVNVDVIDTTNNTVIDTISDLGNGAGDMVILPDDSKLYVANTQDATVSVVDTSSNTEVTSIAAGIFPYGLDVTSDGSKVYLVAIGDIFGGGTNGGVWEINTATDTADEFFETDDGSVLPASIGDFILEETATDTVSITVSATAEEDEALADTGTSQTALLLASAVLIITGGFVLRRYNS